MEYDRSGGSTIKVKMAEVPPPGEGLLTATECVPPVRLPEESAAVNEVELTKVVVRLAESHRMTELDTKFEPVRVNVTPLAPAEALMGLMEVSVGIGLFTVKVTVEDVPPPGVGLNTLIVWVLPVRYALGMEAVSWVELP